MATSAIHVLSIALCLSSGFQQGYIASVLNQPYKEIEDFISECWTNRTGSPMSPTALNLMWSLLNVTFPLSGIFGQFLAAWMCKRWGRKNTALIASAMYVPGALMCFASKYTAPYFELIFIGRIIWSVANGVNSVNATVWIVECAPAAIRGRMAAMQEFAMAFGSLVTQAAGVLWSTPELWQWNFIPNVVFSLLSIVMFAAVWESPQYIVENECDMEKCASFSFIVKAMNLKLSAKKLCQEKKRKPCSPGSSSLPVDDPTVSAELRVCQEAFRKKSTLRLKREKPKPMVGRHILPHNSLTVIFNPRKASDDASRVVRHAAWLGVAVKIAYVFTGARCLRSYSTFILYDLSGWTMQPALILSFVTGLLRLPITLVPVFLVDRLGRRPLILYSIVISAVSLVVLEVAIGIGEKYASMVSLTTLLLINACGLGSVSRFYAAELVPRSLLLSSVSILAMFEAITKIVVEFAWFPMANAIHGESLLLFTIPTIFFVGVVYWMCPETSCRSVNDVLDEIAESKGLRVTFELPEKKESLRKKSSLPSVKRKNTLGKATSI